MPTHIEPNLHTNNAKQNREITMAVHTDSSSPPAIHQGSPAFVGSHNHEAHQINTCRAMLVAIKVTFPELLIAKP